MALEVVPIARPKPYIEGDVMIPIRVSPEVLEEWAFAFRATVELGEPDADGFYEPVFTRHERWVPAK